MATSLAIPGSTITAPQGTDTVGAYSSPNGPMPAPATPAAPVAPVTQPVTPPVAPQPANPIADSSVRRYTGAGVPATTAAPEPANDATLRASELANVQGKIDTINSDFVTNMNQTNEDNANLMGLVRGEQARGGNLGSTIGNEAIGMATEKAAAATAKVQTDRKNAIDTVYDGIQKDIDAKETAWTTQNNKLTATQTATLQKNSVNYITNLAKSGGSLDDLTQDEYNHIVDTSGLDDAQIRAQFAANVPADKVVHQSVINGQYVQVTRDPVTGKVETNVIPLTGVPDDYTYNASLQAFVPKGGIDPTKSTESQIIPYAKATSPAAAKTPGTAAAKAAETKAAADDLQAAQNAITKGADPAKVRQTYIEHHPGSVSLYDKFMNPGNKSKTPYVGASSTSTNPFQ